MEKKKRRTIKEIIGESPKLTDEEYMAIQNANDRKLRFRENRDVAIFIVFIIGLVYFAVTPLQYALIATVFIGAGPLVWVSTRRGYIGFLGILMIYIFIGGFIGIVSFFIYLYTFL